MHGQLYASLRRQAQPPEQFGGFNRQQQHKNENINMKNELSLNNENGNGANRLLSDVWQTSDRPFRDYPIGTKAQAQGGGYWIKNERGWKWCTGATFPAPGGDWNGMISLPNCS